MAGLRRKSKAFDRDKFIDQIRFMKKLRRMKYRELMNLHERKFRGTKFYVKPKRWMSRRVIERRLWMLYTALNYHYPPGHDATKHFKKRAAAFLAPKNLGKVRREEESIRKLKDLERFSKDSIKSMPINEVDRFLVALNILCLKESEDTRRKVLWEMFNSPRKEVPKTHNKEGKKVRATKRGRFTNKYVLRDIIVNNPTMDYLEFRETYGNVMPTVTSGSFRWTRWLLRKHGFSIPKLKSNSRFGGSPVVRNEKRIRD